MKMFILMTLMSALAMTSFAGEGSCQTGKDAKPAANGCLCGCCKCEKCSCGKCECCKCEKCTCEKKS